MSADNGIYILHNTNKEGQKEYRVAYAQAIDNLAYCDTNDFVEDWEKYVNDVWGDSHVYDTLSVALTAASALHEEVAYYSLGYEWTEYGICSITDYANLPFGVYPTPKYSRP